jgi:hypothetical protein
MERGAVPSAFNAQPQPMPIAAAAMLSGIHAFLSEIPELVERRGRLQRLRRVDDRVLLERFGTHWLAPSGSRLQAEHQAMHDAIVEEFEIAALCHPSTAEEPHRQISAAGHLR